jgi:UDP-glucose 4-epimerase
MNIAVTGAAGYIGRKIMTRMRRESDICLFGIDVRAPRPSPSETFYRMDIRDPGIAGVFRENTIDCVFHLAFLMPPFKDKQKAYDNDVNGTRNVLDACRKAGVRKFILPSSTTVYGANPDNPRLISEDAPYRGDPDYYYYRDKVDVEKVCLEFFTNNPEMEYVIFRICEVYGPDVDAYYTRSLETRKVHLFEGFDPEYQFVHVDDVAEAFVTAARKCARGVFNLVADGVMKLSETTAVTGRQLEWTRLNPSMLGTLRALYRLGLFQTPVESFSYWQYRWTASNEKLKRELGFTPRFTTREAFESKYFTEDDPIVRIDSRLCTCCGACVRSCPLALFRGSTGTIPAVRDADLCIVCGHCILSCPVGAVRHGSAAAVKIHAVRSERLPGKESVLEFFRTRRSVRRFSNETVSRDVIEEVIRGAGLAPSAHNTQSTKYLVLRDPVLIEKLGDESLAFYRRVRNMVGNPLNRFFINRFAGSEMRKVMREMEIAVKQGKMYFTHGAKTFIVFYSDPSLRYPEINAHVALYQALLTAHALGLGGFIAGYLMMAALKSRRIRSLLGLNRRQRIHGILALGYPEQKIDRWVERKEPEIHWL